MILTPNIINQSINDNIPKQFADLIKKYQGRSCEELVFYSCKTPDHFRKIATGLSKTFISFQKSETLDSIPDEQYVICDGTRVFVHNGDLTLNSNLSLKNRIIIVLGNFTCRGTVGGWWRIDGERDYLVTTGDCYIKALNSEHNIEIGGSLSSNLVFLFGSDCICNVKESVDCRVLFTSDRNRLKSKSCSYDNIIEDVRADESKFKSVFIKSVFEKDLQNKWETFGGWDFAQRAFFLMSKGINIWSK